MKYSVEFNNVISETFKVYAVKRPDIPAPEYDLDEIQIPGRDGVLHIDNKRFKPVTIPIEFNYIGAERDWAGTWRAIKKWLVARDSTLKFSDDDEYFYKVYYVKLDVNNRVTSRIGRFTANFICHPYMYLVQGVEEIIPEKTALPLMDADGEIICEAGNNPLLTTYWIRTVLNAFDECHPSYVITGKGLCEIRINDKRLHANIVNKLIINTELQAAYRENGEKVNQTISGKYSDLWLKPGSNKLEINSGFELSIVPNWREL